jgi:hypothetical protein
VALAAAVGPRVRGLLAASPAASDSDVEAEPRDDAPAARPTLERALCDRIRAGLNEAAQRRARAAIREGLRARLGVTTPGFDLSETIE